MLALREMIRGSMRLLILWVVLCLACGDIAGTYLAAVGLGGVLAGQEYRRRGAVLLGLGVGWFVAVTAIGGGQGSSLSGHYGYLVAGSAAKVTNKLAPTLLVKDALLHPEAILRAPVAGTRRHVGLLGELRRAGPVHPVLGAAGPDPVPVGSGPGSVPVVHRLRELWRRALHRPVDRPGPGLVDQAAGQRLAG